MKRITYHFKRVFSSLFGISKTNYLQQTDKSLRRLDRQLKGYEQDAYAAGLAGTEKIDNLIKSLSVNIDLEKEKAIAKLKKKRTQLEVKLTKLEFDKVFDGDKEFAQQLNILQVQNTPAMAEEIAALHALNREHGLKRNRLNIVLSKINSNAPTAKAFLDKYLPFILISGAIGILEAFVSTSLWEALLDLIFLFGILASILYSIILVVTAHQIGEAWYDDSKDLKRALFIGSLSVGFIVVARLIVEPSTFMSAIALIVLYAASVSLAIRKFKYESNFIILEERDLLLVDLKSIEKKILRSKAKIYQLKEGTNILANENTDSKESKSFKAHADIKGNLKIVDNRINEVEQHFEDYRSGAICKLEEAFDLGNSHGNSEPPFNGGNSFWSSGKAALFSLLLLFTMSCDIKGDINSYAIYVGNDVSASISEASKPSSERYHLKMTSLMNLHGKHDSGISSLIRLFEIGDPILSNSADILLPDIGPVLFENRKELEAKLNRFDQELKNGLDDFFNTTPNHHSTNLYRSIGFRIMELADMKVKHKIFILSSDCIAESTVFNAFDYKDKPSLIADDFNKIASRLDEAFELGDLSGIKMIINFSDQNASELSFHCRNFLKRYYESKGASVTIVSNF